MLNGFLKSACSIFDIIAVCDVYCECSLRCILSFNSVGAKPASLTAAAPISSTKPAESKKAITISFSSLRPKPKIFVGAAFFSTGKKPTSMYKKSVPKPSARLASVAGKSKSVAPQTKSDKSQQQLPPPPPVTKPQQKPPAEVRRAVYFALHFSGQITTNISLLLTFFDFYLPVCPPTSLFFSFSKDFY